MTTRRWLKWTIGIAATPVVLLLLIQFTAPLWLDTAAVKGEVAKIVSKATGGRATFARLELRFFPWPRAVLDTVDFELPGTVQVAAKSAEIDIRLLPLLRGSVEPRRLRVNTPRIKLVIAKSAPDTSKPAAKPFSLKDTEVQVRSALTTIASRMPGLEADIDGGHVELDLPGQPPLILENVDVVVSVVDGTVDLSAGVSTAWAKRVAARVQLAAAGVAGTVSVDIDQLDAAALGGAFGADSGWPVAAGMVNLGIDAELHGLTNAHATVTTKSPRVSLRFGKIAIEAGGLSLDATAQTAVSGAVTVTLRQFALDSPSIGASGTLTRDSAGAYTASAGLRDLDLVEAQRVLQSLAPGVPALQGLPVQVTRGTLAEGKLESRASNMGDLFGLPAMAITGALENTDATLTVFQDLPITGASADVSLVGGKLHAGALRARVGATTARDGMFDIDLNPAVPPLRGTVTVAADLAQGFAIAGRVLGKDSAATLGAITGVRGSVLAIASIGGTVDTVVPRVDFSALNAFAHYADFPFPVHIVDGGGSYTTQALAVRGLRGTIGHSAFDSIDAKLTLAGPMVVSASRGSVHLALPELFRWAAAQPKLAKQLDSVKSVSGALSVSVAEVSLPVKTPDQLTFRASAVPSHIVVDAPHFGPTAAVDGGVVHVTQKRVNATAVGVSALDARLSVSGGTEDFRDSTSELLVFAKGIVGLDALAWVWSKAALPSSLALRGALRIDESTVSVRRGAGIGASGTVTVEGGPEIGFDLHTATDRLQIDQFTLRDSASSVNAGVSIEGEKIKALWKGRLAGSSVDHMFLHSPVALDYIEGDLRVDGNLKHPENSRATGTLGGAAIRLSRAAGEPLAIDRLAVEAKDSMFVLRTADLSSGASRVSVTGSVAFRDQKFIVDADVRADTVIIPATVHHADTTVIAAPAPPVPAETNAQKESKFIAALHAIPAQGSVRVGATLLRVGRMDFTGLQAGAAIHGTRIDLSLTRGALCGIGMAGGLVLEHDTVDVTFALAAKDAPITGAVSCLSNKRIDITGNVTANGKFDSRGPVGTTIDNLHGVFKLTAKNGRINKFDELARVLKVVNVTQVFVGQSSDFKEGGMAYKTIDFDLDIVGPRIEVKAFSLDASGLDAGAHGTLDFDTRAIDIDVLVAPVKTANWIIDHTPIVRSIFGGSILALPVHVGGTFEKPLVVPLGAKAVSSRLFDILGNTVKLPTKLIKTDSAGAKP